MYALKAIQVTYTTPVQAQILPSALQGKDLLVKAKTSAEKAVAFLIPAIEKIAAAEKSLKLDRQKISVLVLTPSRGHAERIQQQARALAQYHRYWVESIFGGYNVSKELDRIRSTSVIDILIATPSRLLTHVRETDGFAKRLQQVLLVVVDEADELVNRDFLKDMVQVLGIVPNRTLRQTMMFSATVTQTIQYLIRLSLRAEHTFIDTIGKEDLNAVPDVEQYRAVVPLQDQLAVLESVLQRHVDQCPDYKIVVFSPTARQASFWSMLFGKLGLRTLPNHSRKSRAYQRKAGDEFNSATQIIMFASDIIIRRNAFPDTTLVVQVGWVPRDMYVRRMQRTTREGQVGKSVFLLSEFEAAYALDAMPDLPIKDIGQDDVVAKAEMSAQLKEVLDSVEKDAELAKAAGQAYQAFLGFYNSHLKPLNWTKDRLVEMSNEFASLIGLERPPALPKQLAKKMGLMRASGVTIADTAATSS
ncbi:ATP-dependent RNA helicase [Plasmodiophora brassicae]